MLNFTNSIKARNFVHVKGSYCIKAETLVHLYTITKSLKAVKASNVVKKEAKIKVEKVEDSNIKAEKEVANNAKCWLATNPNFELE